MATLKGVIRSAKAVAKGYSDLELKVRQATCNDKWGPSSHLLQEILMASEVGSDGRVILEVLDRRLNDSGKNWRHVYKSLTVYQYLIENGPEYIVNHAKRNLPAIKTLKEYQYVDETGVDHGQNVRLKSREVAALLVDEAKLGQIRANRGTSAGTARAALQYSGAENNEDDELRRAIELSREQASIDERRRKQNELMRQEYSLLIREADLQRAIEDSERDALDRRRSQINTGKNLVENDDIIDFFGSIEEPKTQFGNFDPFQQQQQLMWQQEQQRMMMEQQQQQYFMQQQQEQARIMMMQQQQMEQQNRQQMLMKQQQEENARQQMMQNQFANQYANHQNNPFAAPAPKKSPLQEPQNPADFSSNPNAVLDPFSKVAKIQNPSGPNIASVGGATTQGSNPFSQFGNLNEEKKPADNRYQYQSSPESNSIYSGNNMRPPNGLGLGNANMMSNSPKLNNAQPNFQQQQQQQMGNKMMQNPMMTGFGASASPAMQPMATGTPIQNPMVMQTNNMMQQSNMQQQQQFPDAFGGINPFDNFQPRQQPQQQQFQQSPMNQQQQMLQQQQQLRQPQNPNPFNF